MKCREWSRQLKSRSETHCEGERAKTRALPVSEEKYKERDHHLRRYHQQLQQFVPSSSMSSKPHLPSSSICASLSFSTFLSPCPSLQHSPHLSGPSVLYNGLEEVLDAYRGIFVLNPQKANNLLNMAIAPPTSSHHHYKMLSLLRRCRQAAPERRDHVSLRMQVKEKYQMLLPPLFQPHRMGVKCRLTLKNSSENLAQPHVHSNTEVNPNMSASPQAEIVSDSTNSIMDPLRVSLLQVDQEAATCSFIQGEQSITSICLLVKATGADYTTEVEEEHLSYAEMERNVVKEKNEEFSLLELAEAKNYHIPTSNITAANNCPEPKKEMYDTHQFYEIGKCFCKLFCFGHDLGPHVQSVRTNKNVVYVSLHANAQMYQK
ncbi:uncharacterized protein LOC117510606 [Thalassophryne amazonica]|uniref:uncharacterized protein LOC117510606 n=1 Tax=Thalassophryne amazonica TaxID=390379 RepID=UPI001472349F|nr:uncharacterized protein LOC117510606 [Thalassophryne amazonica]